MLDNIRRYHTFGHNYDLSSLAFSQPTQDGKNFAFSYASHTTVTPPAASSTATATTFGSTIRNKSIAITMTDKENDVNRNDEDVNESFIYVYA